MPDEFSPQNPQPAPPQNSRGGGLTDPSVLTTEALTRQITNLKELLVEKINGNTILLESAKELNEAKFCAIEKNFDGIESWRKEQKLDTKTAVDAALQAAEKAVREQTVASEKAIMKSESSSIEQAKQQFATLTAHQQSLSIILNDIKERVLRIESRKEGEVDNKASTRDQRTDSQYLVFAICSLAIAAVAVVISVTR